MRNNIKITAIIVIILLITAFVFYKNKNTDSDVHISPDIPVAETSYVEKNGTFSFSYNPDFAVADEDENSTTDWRVNNVEETQGMILTTVTIPRSFMSGTNFSEARFTVGRSTDPKAIKSCTVKSAYEDPMVINQEVSGMPFQRFSSSDAGAGNFYETTSYRAIVDGDCYALEYTIHSTNIGNYPPEQGIKEFDKTQVVKELKSIINSFTFLINSD